MFTAVIDYSVWAHITDLDQTAPILTVSQTCFHRIWMNDLRFYVLFNGISVISGKLEADNERLCAMEPCLRF